eukprot:2982720-Amphidinium_carterae.1
MDGVWYKDILSRWKPSGGEPSPVTSPKQGLFGTRLATSLGIRRMLSLAISARASSSVTLTELASKKLKLENLIDQGLSDEFSITKADHDDAMTAYKKYTKLMGGPPSLDEQPHIEQLLALKKLLELGYPPFVDFSVWVPHAARNKKKMKFHGLILQADASLGQQ